VTEHTTQIEGVNTEDADQIERQELFSFRQTMRSIEWLLPLIAVIYFIADDIIIGDRLPLQLIIGAYAVFLGFMQLVRWSDKNIWSIMSAEIWGMLLFISLLLWQTGGIKSPLLCLYFFPIIASAVSLPRRSSRKLLIITFFCFSLAFPNGEFNAFTRRELISTALMIFSFWLVSYIAALLSISMLKARHQIQQLSETDYLTGLQNMRTFLPLARMEYERSIRYGVPFSILMIDADNLKSINEMYGHYYGSSMVRQIGEGIARNIRASDIAARYGGDEFVVLLHKTDSACAMPAAERLRMDIERTSFAVPGGSKSITISIGIACFPDHGVRVEDIITRADKALFTSKKQGKNRSTVAGQQGQDTP
jgi:diguanylate cyclase (GGDEF)-like protein